MERQEVVEMLEVEWWAVRWRWSLEVWVVKVDDHRVQVVVVPVLAPQKRPDQKEGALRQEVRRVCCVR